MNQSNHKTPWLQRLSAAVVIAKQVGEMLLEATLQTESISEKAPNDIVTTYDTAAENMIVGYLRECFPQDGFWGEESGESDAQEGSGRWIIDPIDGTVNFTRSIPDYTISIAYEETLGKPLVGVVFNPRQHELFTAVSGEGAFLNGQPIKVSSVDDPSVAMSLISPPHRKHWLAPQYFRMLQEIFVQTRDIRDLGSAALHLCYLACARADGFFEYGLHYYDIAAGMVILQEAGGVYETFVPSEHIPQSGDIIASNGKLQTWYANQIRDSLSQSISSI